MRGVSGLLDSSKAGALDNLLGFRQQYLAACCQHIAELWEVIDLCAHSWSFTLSCPLSVLLGDCCSILQASELSHEPAIDKDRHEAAHLLSLLRAFVSSVGRISQSLWPLPK